MRQLSRFLAYFCCSPAERNQSFAMPRRAAPRFNVGDINQPITGWSVTLGNRQSEVPVGWLDQMETYSRLFGVASLFALEVGGRVRRMHVQGCKFVANEEGKILDIVK